MASWAGLVARVRRRPLRYRHDLPVFVICRDRVEPLRALLAWLEAEGLTNVILVDNDSTYPPLLELYAATTHRVVRLGANVGHNAAWEAGLVDRYAAGSAYVVTDPDVVPDDGAHGAVRHFARLLSRHPGYLKAGFGLRIDDLPEHYAQRAEVLAWETQMWAKPVGREVFQAPIDTTFALYRAEVRAPVLGPALRTGGRFVARHEPWYADSAHPSDEMTYYRAHARASSATWGLSGDDTDARYRLPE